VSYMPASAVMVDFLTAEMPDPFGFVINGGEVVKVKEDGEVEWATQCKKEVTGSWDSKMMVRNRCCDVALVERKRTTGLENPETRAYGFELSGNPSKFLNGHNLFGSADVAALAQETMSRVYRSIMLEVDPDRSSRIGRFDVAEGKISRIDLTASWLVPSAADVLPFLKAMQERCHCPYRGRGVEPPEGPGTLYFGYSVKGKRAKDWQLKIYAKGLDLKAHPLPAAAFEIPGLAEDVCRTIRVELTLRTAELKRLNLHKIGAWTPDMVALIWSKYVDRLQFGDGFMNAGHNEGLSELMGPRQLDALHSWMAGNDLSLTRNPRTFRRLRKEVRDASGFDISMPPPTSNVIPLRRIIEATPALRPHWADDLTAALRAA